MGKKLEAEKNKTNGLALTINNYSPQLRLYENGCVIPSTLSRSY